MLFSLGASFRLFQCDFISGKSWQMCRLLRRCDKCFLWTVFWVRGIRYGGVLHKEGGPLVYQGWGKQPFIFYWIVGFAMVKNPTVSIPTLSLGNKTIFFFTVAKKPIVSLPLGLTTNWRCFPPPSSLLQASSHDLLAGTMLWTQCLSSELVDLRLLVRAFRWNGCGSSLQITGNGPCRHPDGRAWTIIFGHRSSSSATAHDWHNENRKTDRSGGSSTQAKRGATTRRRFAAGT